MTPIQHSVIMSLYEVDDRGQKWYVKTRALKTSVVKSLYKLGMIEADQVFNGIPTRFKLSEAGREYGRQHYKGSENRTEQTNRRNEIRNRYDHYDFITRRSNVL